MVQSSWKKESGALGAVNPVYSITARVIKTPTINYQP
jgi:hypothetical protein